MASERSDTDVPVLCRAHYTEWSIKITKRARKDYALAPALDRSVLYRTNRGVQKEDAMSIYEELVGGVRIVED